MTDPDTDIIVCISGAFPDAASISSFIDANPDLLSGSRYLVEIRLDLLPSGNDAVFEQIARLGGQAVVSCRTRTDGGRWSGSEPERLALLARAAELGPAFVDVELATWMRGGGESVRRSCRGGCRIMVSVHENGSSDFFGDLASKLNATGATAVKLAGVTRDAGDLMKLAAAGRRLTAATRCVVGMGGAGAFSRMRPGDFGANMTFGSAASGMETAAGQPCFRKLCDWRVFESPRLEPVVLFGGDQVTGSPGPDIYNHLFRENSLAFQYLALPVADWSQAVAATGCFGIRRFAVTMPYKTFPIKQWPGADCDEWAGLTGVVNTVVIGPAGVRLFNTDAAGMAEILDRLGGAAEKDILVMGGGATARSVAAAGIRGGAVVSVSARNSVVVAREWPQTLPGVRFSGWERRGEFIHDIVVNATPIGADGRSSPIDCSGLRAQVAAVDVVVSSHGRTCFIADAVKLRLKTAGGLDFWCAQAPAQLRAFTGRDFDHADVARTMALTGHGVSGVMAVQDDDMRPGEGMEPVELAVPGSKSLTQRYVVLAALGRYPVRLLHPSPSRDCADLQNALAQLGARFGRTADALDIYPADFPKDPEKVIQTGEGGTTIRFLTALSLMCDFPLRLEPSGAMTHRPMEQMLDALTSLGVEAAHDGGIFTLRRTDSSKSRVTVDGTVSSQFASALLLAGFGLPGGMTVDVCGDLVSRPYLEMTVEAIRQFGGRASSDGQVYSVSPGTDIMGLRLKVEYDASLSAFWDAASMIYGRRIDVVNRPAGGGKMQGDTAFAGFAEHLAAVGDVEMDLGGTPDLLPPLILPALFREGRTTFCGLAHARSKESDRLSVLAEGLGLVGADIALDAGSLTVTPCRLRGPAVLDPHGDHRMAMTFGILSLRVPGLKILDPGCVDKSYPAFWQDLEKVRN